MATDTKQDRCRKLRRGGLKIEEIMTELRASRAEVLAWLGAGNRCPECDAENCHKQHARQP